MGIASTLTLKKNARLEFKMASHDQISKTLLPSFSLILSFLFPFSPFFLSISLSLPSSSIHISLPPSLSPSLLFLSRVSSSLLGSSSPSSAHKRYWVHLF